MIVEAAELQKFKLGANSFLLGVDGPCPSVFNCFCKLLTFYFSFCNFFSLLFGLLFFILFIILSFLTGRSSQTDQVIRIELVSGSVAGALLLCHESP